MQGVLDGYFSSWSTEQLGFVAIFSFLLVVSESFIHFPFRQISSMSFPSVCAIGKLLRNEEILFGSFPFPCIIRFLPLFFVCSVLVMNASTQDLKDLRKSSIQWLGFYIALCLDYIKKKLVVSSSRMFLESWYACTNQSIIVSFLSLVVHTHLDAKKYIRRLSFFIF